MENTSLTQSFDITAAGCDAARRLPPARLVADIIDLATAHADSLGVGYRTLQPLGVMWVLGRLSIQVSRWPAIYDSYSLTTWVQGINRLMSERDFELRIGPDLVGHARTIWSAIDIDTRRAAPLTPVLRGLGDVATPGRPCPIDKAPRLAAPDEPSAVRPYSFSLSDLDVNRHVTTTRYVDLIVDAIPLDLYDRSALCRLDIAFHREARYGDTVEVLSDAVTIDGATTVTAAITEPGNPDAVYCAGRIILTANN